MVFRREKTFSIKIPRGELFPESLAADQTLVKDGVVTPQGIAELRTRMPHADVEKFSKNPKVENIQELFTVQMIVNFLQTKLAGGATYPRLSASRCEHRNALGLDLSIH